jgi:CubicO group peptidase (beta-lactamase class C family)
VRRVVLAACLALLAPLAAEAKPELARAEIDSLRTRIRGWLATEHVPSVAIAVTQHGRVVWEEGFGLADVARRVPAGPATRYSLASVTKPITATALMTLVERGQVDLDRPANTYLGTPGIVGLAGSADSATVRTLLNHTSGLPNHARFWFAGDTTRADMDEVIRRYAITVYPPGTVYNYSNLGFGLVQRILERVSGRAFGDYLRDAVFRPLGMKGAVVSTGADLADAAVRYGKDGQALPPYDTDHAGASGVYASVHDLARFAMFHLGDRLRDQQSILSARSRDAMHRVETPGDTTQGYGLGWEIDRVDGRSVLVHLGGMPGVEAEIRLDPRNDVAIVVLSNSENDVVGRIVAAIDEAIVPPPPPAPPDTAAGRPETFEAPASLVGEWSGSIRTWDGQKVPLVVRVKPDDVHVRFGPPGTFSTVLNAARFIPGNSILFGAFTGTIPTADARRSPHYVVLALWYDGTRLRGWAAATSTDPANPYALSSYAELTRKER